MPFTGPEVVVITLSSLGAGIYLPALLFTYYEVSIQYYLFTLNMVNFGRKKPLDSRRIKLALTGLIVLP
jgi:hypothetical protein